MRRWPAVLLLLAAACAPAPEPDTRPFGLYRAMQACLSDPAGAGCSVVDRQRGFVVIKDDDPAKPLAWLLVPDVEVTGIEDPRVLQPPVVEFWRWGWEVGRELPGRPPEATGLAINSAAGRSQDLLHIHISCVRPDVARALAAAPVGPDWRGHPFLRLAGGVYDVRRVATLEPSPFLLLHELPGAAEDMAAWSLAVIGAAEGGYYVAAEATRPGAPAAAEALLDEGCS